MASIGGAVRELIDTALTDTDPDGALRWQAITRLQERGDQETFIEARRLCDGETINERVLGVDILGQLGRPGKSFADQSLPVLRRLAAGETDAMVLYSVLIAFGHLKDSRTLPSVIALAEHTDPRVRYGAAYALPNVLGNPPDQAGLAALGRLVHDTDDDVADWATLGLALTSGSKIEDIGG
ncbi:HEAT repeat domain-containing protein [Streptosporangium sp. KLBMP 9127]|nr:HEAT repeat domain-containing protein [Streptosporangium sp. KLBMP 9127]